MIPIEIPSKKMMNASWSEDRHVGECLEPTGGGVWLVIGQFGERCILVPYTILWRSWLSLFRDSFEFEYRKGGGELWAVSRTGDSKRRSSKTHP